jgi:hypothetical protein
VSLEGDELERRLPNTHNWQTMSPGDKQAWLLDQALDRKREILALPLPDESDDSVEATRLRSLILAAADSTISQTIALRMLTPATARDSRDREIEAVIEERRQKVLLKLEQMRDGPVAWTNGRDGHGEHD